MFVSMIFPLFLGMTMALFFVLPAKWRPSILLLTSYLFCAWIDVWALIVLVMVSFCTWMAGNRIEKFKGAERKSEGKVYTTVVICFYIALLCIYKYLPHLLTHLGVRQQLPENLLRVLVMPAGLSFYLFQAIGYVADVYKGKCKAEKNFWHFSCYLAFFPKLVSGPIEREQDFLPQIMNLGKATIKDRGRLSTAFTYMLWGYFMKMVVADRLAVTVNRIFYDPSAFDSFWLILGVFFYTIQIYCDFAGYSYIAIGCARIFRVNLTQNFKAPYFAGSITDFWRRWHVSLSEWLRDYIYIPLGGNRNGFARKCINTMVVFLICGMWHGVGLHFIAWGFLHGFYLIIEAAGRRKGWKIAGGRMITFVAVSFAWIFFKADSLTAAVFYIAKMLTAGIQPHNWQQMAELLQLNMVEITLIVIGIVVIGMVDGLCNRRKLHLPVLIQYKQNAVRYLVFYLLIIAIFIFGIYGPGYHAERFIYMQF